MIFDILTIFPELLASPLREGILRRALEQQRIRVDLHNIRNFTRDKHQMTDDRPFGGGEGMVLKAEPLAACLRSVQSHGEPGHVVLLSPRGTLYSQRIAERFASYPRLIMICGRYEGVDERIRQGFVDEEISIGDYILTGGELAAMVLVDSITRLLPGVLGCEDSASNDTFCRNLLKHPQYTRPRIFEDMAVPDILLSGDHKKIEQYRFVESIRITLERRPDLLSAVTFTPEELKLLHRSGLRSRIEQIVGTHGR